ncbi:nacht and wd domain protein [Fusarium beomiforme]|uniref:Nacht and wd domain protein n=1 Tax=Fusarium beomiforme TaxID=44412 RepID=A0A9P5E018_9HYPO|nr:nacht and wd domain protein [Fusarium beomiforme]
MKELDPGIYTIAWIAPLEIEAQAALHMLDNRHDGRFPISRGDDYVFLAGDINGHNIVIATLPAGQEYGTGSAAALASQIKKFFPNLWIGLLVGVAAGLPNLHKIPPVDIRLGDVLVGLPEADRAGLVAYDLGKETSDGFQLLRFGQILENTETVVRSAIGNIKLMAPHEIDIFLQFYESIKDKEHSKGTFADPGQAKDTFYDIDNDGLEVSIERTLRPSKARTRVWYGSIGSGDKLTKNSHKRNELRDRYGVIGLEMEAAGTMNRIPVGVIRGVCDYADRHKNKEWQPYAAAMAAAYAKAVIHELGPSKTVPISHGEEQPLCGAILCELPPASDRFFGRDDELLEMIKCLETTTLRKGVVLCGISGSGKTQLAREYIERRRSKFSAVLWIDASSEESIEESMSICSNRICEHTPKFQTGKESTARQLVLDWLRTTPEKNWLTVIDNANGHIPNRRLLEPFLNIREGSLCVISTQQVTARALKLQQVVVQDLDLRASQSLLLWRAYDNDKDYDEDGKRTVKLLHGFPLALELAGVVHQRGIMPLSQFPESFMNDYPDVAQFQVDSGAWMWTKNGAVDTLFDVSKVVKDSSFMQLQVLARSKIKLNKAIDELSKIFLAVKKQANDHSLLSFSLHSSICQWRLATMENGDLWVIQATYGLSKYILSLNDEHTAFRFFNIFHRCLDLLWKHVDSCHIDIYGKFAKAYFTICLCGAEIYAAVGRYEIAKTLFTSAIDSIRSSSAGNTDESVLLRLLCGLGKCCERIKEFEQAEEALSTALEISDRLKGHMDHTTVDLVSRLKAVRDHLLTQLENRKRALVASTAPKLALAMNPSADLSTSKLPLLTPLPNLAWDLRFKHAVLPISTQKDGSGLSVLSDVLPKTMQGTLSIYAYDDVKVKSIHLEIFVFGKRAGSRKEQKTEKSIAGNVTYFDSWKLRLCEVGVTTSDEYCGDNCASRTGGGRSSEHQRQLVSKSHTSGDHFLFSAGSYTYQFETPVDCITDYAETYMRGDTDWHFLAVASLLYDKSTITLRKELPIIQIPYQLSLGTLSPEELTGNYEDDISSMYFRVNLPFDMCPIGGKLPIEATLNLFNNNIQVEYLSYSIIQKTKRWSEHKEESDTEEQKLVLLQRFMEDTSLLPGRHSLRGQTDGDWVLQEETCEFKPLKIRDGTKLNHKLFTLFDDLVLPTCKQIDGGRLVAQETLGLSRTTPIVEINHVIQITIGGSYSHPRQTESLSQASTESGWEMTEEIPVTVIDCRVFHRNDLGVERMARDPNLTRNKTTACGCPDADDFEETVSKGKWRSHNGPTSTIFKKETSTYIREVYGKSEGQVRVRNARLESLGEKPIVAPNKPQSWEAFRSYGRNSLMGRRAAGQYDMELDTTTNTSEGLKFTIDASGEPPPYSHGSI